MILLPTFRTLLFALAACASLWSLSASSRPQEPLNKPVIVIVHGAWGGGWAWRDVAHRFEELGYRVYRPTLTGLGEKVHLATAETGLSTHIQDVVNLLRYEDLSQVTLIGHSYGGMVITGVAHQQVDRLKQVIYLDALLPESGQPVLSKEGLSSSWIDPLTRGDFIYPVWVSKEQLPPRDEPQPLKTFTESIKFENPKVKDLASAYLLTVDPGKQAQQDDFYRYYQRAIARGWPHDTLTAGHNPQWEDPDQLVKALQKLFIHQHPK